MDDILVAVLFTYWLLSSLLCLGGNGFTFYATLFYKAIGIDQKSVTFIRYLTIADSLFGFAQIFGIFGYTVMVFTNPSIKSATVVNIPLMFTNNTIVNQFIGTVNVISWSASEILVLSITSHRLYTVLHPLSSAQLSKSVPHTVCVIIFIIAIVFAFCLAILPGKAAVCGARALFHVSEICPKVGSTKKFSDLTIVEGTMMLVFLMFYVAYFAILITNAILLIVALKLSRNFGRSFKRPLLTTLLVGVLFVVSWTPFMIWITIMIVLRCYVELGYVIDDSWNGMLYKYELADQLLYSISIYGNPIIYTCINQQFRIFTVMRIRQMWNHVRYCRYSDNAVAVSNSDNYRKRSDTCMAGVRITS